MTVEPGHSLTISAGAGRLRRSLGPTAWLLLEELLLRSQPVSHDGDRLVSTSVRTLASSLGLAKDTVARALRRLSDEGLVFYVANRAHDGRFGASHYRVAIPPDCCLEIATPPAPPPTPSRTLKPNHRGRPPLQTQLSLIDVDDLDPPTRLTTPISHEPTT